MTKKIKQLHLNSEQLGLLFTQLHQLEYAGLPCNRGLEVLARSNHVLKKPLLLMLKQVNEGRLVSEAGFNSGLFTNTQRVLLEAAETSGQLASVYKQLARYYTELNKRIKRFKSRSFISGFVLTLSLFIEPIPDLVSGQITTLIYLERSIGYLMLIIFSLFSLIKLPRLLDLLGLEIIWHYLQFNLPFIKSWVIKRQLNAFFFILAMMLQSGVAFSEALPQSVATIKNVFLKKQFDTALVYLTEGHSVTQVLSLVSVMDSTMMQIIASGEHSGKLASSLLHFYMIESETISLQDDALVDWLGRLIYAVVAIWMAYSVLHSSFLANIPKNL